MIIIFFVINKLGKFKISDFGLPIFLGGNIHATIETNYYKPPEAPKISIKSDIYSLGICFSVMLTRNPGLVNELSDSLPYSLELIRLLTQVRYQYNLNINSFIR
jgi:serine/threonine protein kinase